MFAFVRALPAGRRRQPLARLMSVSIAALLLIGALPAAALAASPTAEPMPSANASTTPVVTPTTTPAPEPTTTPAPEPTIAPTSSPSLPTPVRPRVQVATPNSGDGPIKDKRTQLVEQWREAASKSSPANASTPMSVKQEAVSPKPGAAGPVARLLLYPSDVRVTVGSAHTFVVAAFDAAGKSLGDVTTSADFSIDKNTAACKGNVCTPQFVGDFQIVATVGSLNAVGLMHVRPASIPNRPPLPTDSAREGASATAGPAAAAAVTSNAATVQIAGRVTSQSGAGLAGILLSATSMWPAVTTTQATTDGSGAFSIPVAPNAQYILGLTDPLGHHLAGYYSATAPGHVTTNYMDQTMLSVQGNDLTRLTLAMTDAVALSGVLVNRAGTPLKGITVWAMSMAGASSVTTDASGAYHLALPSGSYTLDFSDPANVYGYYYYATTGLTPDLRAATAVTVGGSDVNIGTIVLPARVHISGTIENEAGTPLSGIQIQANTGYAGGDTASTDANGRYTLSVNPDQGYTIPITDPNQQYVPGYYVNGFSLFEPGYGEPSISMAESDVSGVDATLPAGVHISGRVTNTAGNPISGAWVTPSFDAPMDLTSSLVGAQTDSTGRYTLVVLPNRQYYLRYWSSGDYVTGYHGPNGYTSNPYAATPVTVRTQSVTGIDAVMSSYVTLSGRVVDASGQPRSGIRAIAIFDNGNYSFGGNPSDGSGNYSIQVAASADYVIQFWQPGAYADIGYYDAQVDGHFTMRQDLATPVSVGYGGLPGIDATVPFYHVIGGTVTAGNGSPLVGIEVRVFDPSDGTTYATAVTGSQGTWSARVMPKTYSLYFYDKTATWANGYLGDAGFTYLRAEARAIPITNADDTSENVVLGPPIHLKGTVTKAGGAIVAGLEVDVYDAASGALWDFATTDSTGNYSVVVIPGSYMVGTWDETVTYPNGYWSPTGFTQNVLEAGTTAVLSSDVTVNVQLPVAHLLSGTLTDVYGSPGQDIAVTLFTAAGEPLMTVALTDQYGGYDVLALVGSYYVGVGDPSGVFAEGYWDGSGFTSEWSEAALVPINGDVSLSFQIPRIPDAPTSVHATRGDGAVAVTWSAPARDGGLPITSYVVYSDVGERWCEWTSGPLSCTVTGLTNGTSYAFFVFGINGAGYGPDSDPSNVVTPAGLPGAPTGVTATAGVRAVTVSWTPANPNGASVTAYTVTSSPSTPGCTTTGATNCTVTGLDPATLYTFQVQAANEVGRSPLSSAVQVKPLLSGATYHPLTPTRLLDTRIDLGIAGALRSHVAQGFQATGSVVPAGATGVTGNLTVTAQSSLGFLYIGPVAMNAPTSSTLNFPAGDDRANAVTVALSSDGKLFVTYAAPTASATAHAIFDVTGYFTPDATGATYHPLAPTRILDSRDGNGLSGVFPSHIARSFVVRGRGGVPANATAVTGNLTVTQQSSLGFVYIGPNGAANPTSSTLNFPKGDDRANSVTVALADDGRLWVTFAAPTASASAQVIFDVTGYFTADTTGAAYVPLVPVRIVDSRNGIVLFYPLFSHHSVGFRVRGPNGIPLNAVAVTGNLTVTQQSSNGFFYLGPTAADNPTSSNLNFPRGDDRANAVTVALSADGELYLTFAAPTVGPTAHAILDATGYFVP